MVHAAIHGASLCKSDCERAAAQSVELTSTRSHKLQKPFQSHYASAAEETELSGDQGETQNNDVIKARRGGNSKKPVCLTHLMKTFFNFLLREMIVLSRRGKSAAR